MPRIFICYRREDGGGHAGRLYDRLVEKFGKENVFMDVDAIEPGTDFVEAVEHYVGSCDVLLAVIGTRWQSGNRRRRRLHEPTDFVRLELSTALKRNIRLIPVLIQEAGLPEPEQLPEELIPLLRRQTFELRDARWSLDCEHLIATLARIPSSGDPPASATRPHESASEQASIVESDPPPSEPPNNLVTGLHPSNDTSDQLFGDKRKGNRSGFDRRILVLTGIAIIIFLGFLGARLSSNTESGSVQPTQSIAIGPSTTPSPRPTAASLVPTAQPSQPSVQPSQPAAVAPSTTPSPRPTATNPVPTAPPRQPTSQPNYADELTDFGIPPQATLRQDVSASTPRTIPGGRVITTTELYQAMVRGDKFVLIDVLDSDHLTIAGAYRLPQAGRGGSFIDDNQQTVVNWLIQLPKTSTLVFFCLGARCWESYNASLRAINAGYTNVYWYRGGLDAWQQAGNKVQ